jgi:diguanylate cyclase (GGDEF)-like protein
MAVLAASMVFAASIIQFSSFILAGLFTIVFLGLCIPAILLITKRIVKPINKLFEQINYDSLTGIYNRRYFDENIKRIIRSLSRSGGVLSLMMVDVDHFKKYNDTYGHRKGDDCLKIIAAVLQKTLRADDFVARYGGEEFVIVLPNTDADDAHIVANRLLECIRNCDIPHAASDVTSCVTISIGVTTGCVDQTQSWRDFVERADELLYEAKQSGRNKYAFSSMTDSAPMSLASAKKTIISLKQKEKSTDTLNKIAFMFLSQSEKSLEDMLTAGIELMVDGIDLDTISVWRNSKKHDGLHISQIYRWDAEIGSATPTLDAFMDITYKEYVPSWEKLFAAGESVNSPVRMLPDQETIAVLNKFGIVSVFASPIVVHDALWGFVLFADRKNERYFDSDSAEMMRSSAYLFANAIIRSELEREVVQAEELAKLMLDTSPLCCQLWDRKLNVIDCNEAAVKLYGFKDKQEYVDRFFECCLPEYQLDGQRSDEKAVKLVNKAFEEGYCRFGWMHKMPADDSLMHAEITLVRVNYKNDYLVVGYTRDLREYYRMMDEVKSSLSDLESLQLLHKP